MKIFDLKEGNIQLAPLATHLGLLPFVNLNRRDGLINPHEYDVAKTAMESLRHSDLDILNHRPIL